jgi:hypothetical protein
LLLLWWCRRLLLHTHPLADCVQHIRHTEPAPARPCSARFWQEEAACAASGAAGRLAQQRSARADVQVHIECCADGGDFVLICCDVLHCVLLQQIAIILVHLHSKKTSMDDGSSRAIDRMYSLTT